MVHLILDLDETLIHTFEITKQFSKKNASIADFYFNIDGQYFWVVKRPGLDLFLEFAFKYFQIGIWTAADKEYAKQICKHILSLDQLHKIKFIYSRNFCHLDRNQSPPCFTKPLQKIFELFPTFNSRNTIMIDNTLHVMKYNPYNGVHISDFTGQSDDSTLYHIRNMMIKYYQSTSLSQPIWNLVNDLNKYSQTL